MLVRALLTLADLTAFLRQAMPLRISMKDPRSWIEIAQPTDVRFVPGRGARVVASGRLQLDIADLRVPSRIKEVTLLLLPALAQPTQLVFKLAVERLDVAYIPGLVEEALLPTINAALASAPLAWDFGKTLHVSLQIPPRFAPLARFDLAVDAAQINVDADQIALSVDLSPSVTRRS